MKIYLLLVTGLLMLSGSAAAAAKDAPVDRGREVIDLKMGGKELKFQHWKHQTSTHNDCFNCHKTTIGVIDGWGKEVAHKTCIPCHDLENKGPMQCQECHDNLTGKAPNKQKKE